MKKIIRFIFMFLLCLNLNVSSNKKDYSNYVTNDTVSIISQNTYNYLLSKNINKVFQNEYYAPYYFKNLVNNFPVNSHDSCNYTAIAMLLSFYDTYLNDNIIPDVYESKSDLNTSSHVHNAYSPGVTYESNTISSLSEADYFSYIMSSYNTDFQSLLIKIARENNIVNSSNFGLDLTQIKNLLNCYLSLMNNNTYSFRTLTSYETNVDPYYFARDYIMQGFPVLLRVGNETNSNGHTVIAYDYNNSNDDFFVHTGWKKNNTVLSHIPLSELFNIGLYDTIYDVIVLLPISTHYHTNNYYAGSTTHCPCQFMHSFNNIGIESTTNYRDKLPKYSWDSTCYERWFINKTYNYEAILKTSQDEIISTYSLSQNEFEIRPADWEKIKNNYENYKLELKFNYTGDDSLINSLSTTKTFTVPNNLIDNPYLRADNFSSLTSGFNVGKNATYTINNNVINADYYKVMYNTNDGQLMMSTIGQNTNFSYLHFNFDTEITRLDIDLAMYDDSQLDLTKGNYRIRAYWINEENVIEYLVSLVEDSENSRIKELPIGIENKETITAYFDFPIDNLMIRYEYLGSNPTSLCKIGVGDINFYKGELPDKNNPLPLSGYELRYEPNKWNDDTMEFYNCYCYALNTKYYGWLCPGWLSEESFSLPFNKSNLVYCIKQDFIKYNEYRNSNVIFIPVSRYETCPIGTYKVALVVDNYNYSGDENKPDYDFHFYRQNADGSWSHKPGEHEVTNLDGTFNKIFDPKICDRQSIYYEELNYSTFFGYYAVSAWG